MPVFLGSIDSEFSKEKKGFSYEYIVNEKHLFIASTPMGAKKQFKSLYGKNAKIKSVQRVSNYPFFSR